MKNFYCFTLFLFSLFYIGSEAQAQRYLSPDFFDSNTVESDVVYGSNYTVLPGTPTLEDLKMDIYQPVGDTATTRPLVLLLHSGSFLPGEVTGLPTGDKTDPALVNIAKRLARRGFVVASCNYRLGWNPLAPNQNPLLFGIMNATYRGIQDTRTAIRFFKNDAANTNLYKIDPNKIVVWGNGTGGFLSLGAANLDSWDVEINECCPGSPTKFYVNLSWGDFVVVEPAINGDIYGTSDGFSPPPPHVFPEGAQLCKANWEGYDSDFQMAVNMGGAVADLSWIDENTVPTVSFHVKTDPLTSCWTDIVWSPLDPPIPIIEVSGSCDYQEKMNSLGLNDAWLGLLDPCTLEANQNNDGNEGFFPFETSEVANNAPWDFWHPTFPNPPFTQDVATAEQTICKAISYFIPRACITLDLGADLSGDWWDGHEDCTTVSIDKIVEAKIDLQTFPNPASESVHFNTKEFPMLGIKVFDLTGRLVKEYSNINEYTFEMQKGNLGNGIYTAQIWFEDGFLSTRIIFQN
jgi:hypothetical protein